MSTDDLEPGTELLIRVRTRGLAVGEIIPIETANVKGWCERSDIVAVLPSSGTMAINEADALRLLAGFALGNEIHPSA